MNVIKLEPAFVDERGSIWDFLAEENVQHIGFLVSKTGSIRGKHYHKIQKQYTLVMEGRIRIVMKDLSKKYSKIESYELDPMNMLLIPPYHYHSIESLEDSKCLIFTSKSRHGTGYEEDTFRIDNIESFELD